MVTRLISPTELERELGPQLFQRALGNSSGVVDTSEGSLCDDIILEASSAVLGALGGAFDIVSLQAESNASNLYEVKRLTRRVARAQIALREPILMQLSVDEAIKLEKTTLDQLKRIRENETNLDAAIPAPANAGGVLSNEVNGQPKYSLTTQGFGDY